MDQNTVKGQGLDLGVLLALLGIGGIPDPVRTTDDVIADASAALDSGDLDRFGDLVAEAEGMNRIGCPVTIALGFLKLAATHPATEAKTKIGADAKTRAVQTMITVMDAGQYLLQVAANGVHTSMLELALRLVDESAHAAEHADSLQTELDEANDAHDEAVSEARAEGYDEGKSDGYDEGHDDGFEEGKEARDSEDEG